HSARSVVVERQRPHASSDRPLVLHFPRIMPRSVSSAGCPERATAPHSSAVAEVFRPYRDHMPATMTFTRYSDVLAVLSDPAFDVPPVAPAGDTVDVGWLRATVSRFATGADHERRRALVEGLLDGLDPVALRAVAEQRSADALQGGMTP